MLFFTTMKAVSYPFDCCFLQLFFMVKNMEKQGKSGFLQQKEWNMTAKEVVKNSKKEDSMP